MSDYISRADAIEAVCRTRCGDKAKGCPAHSCLVIEEFEGIPSAEPHNKDAISREGLLRLWEELSPRGRLEFDQVIMTIPALPSADAVPQLKQTDTLIIADALRYLAKDTERHELDRTRAEELREQILQYGASMCSSADAVQSEECDHCVYKWGMKGGAE